MNAKLFLCHKCAGLLQQCYDAEEIPDTFADGKCDKCGKKRFGCKYEVRK